MAQRVLWSALPLLVAQACVLGDLGGTRTVSGHDPARDSDADGAELTQDDAGPEAHASEEPSAADGEPDAGTSPLDDGGTPDGSTALSELIACYTRVGKAEPTAATLVQRGELLDGMETWHLSLRIATDLVDNSFGETAVGWSTARGGRRRGHTLNDLLTGDHAVFQVVDAQGEPVLALKLDYLSKDDQALSGASSLGVSGGDGKVLQGDPALVVHTSTSLSRNLNERGYTEFLESSPATNDLQRPSPVAPDWEYAVVYDVWLDASVGATGHEVWAQSIHASPSKVGEDVLELVRADCPPDEIAGP